MKGLKNILLIQLLLSSSIQLSAQTIDPNYYPEYNKSVSKSTYDRGKEILKNSYEQYLEASDGETYIDYWNIAFAFSKMGVDEPTIMKYLNKAKALDHNDFCMIVNQQAYVNQGIENTPFYQLIEDEYLELTQSCFEIQMTSITISELKLKKAEIDITKYNEQLIDQLIVCIEKDQRYRGNNTYEENKSKQDILDNEVQIELTKILDTYGYPGKGLVGEPFMNYTCIMIEHGGSLDYQEKYFPHVVEAYKLKQMDKGALKMLVDRIHWKKYKKQIFGSHVGVPFDTPEVISSLREKYGLN